MSRLTDLENQQVSPFGSPQNPLVDPIVKTIGAGTNAFSYPITRTDSGTAAMVTITVPYAGFSGRITILPGGAFTWTAAGNIAVLGTAVVDKALDFVYDPIRAKWYPSYV